MPRWIARFLIFVLGPRPAPARGAYRPQIDIRFVSKEKPVSAEDWSAALAAGSAEARERVLRAANRGDVRAQTALGRMLLAGHGAARDPHTALEWFHRAAESGDAAAANMVGRCYELGWGIARQPAMAILWYRRAAAAGDAWAQFNLAMLLFDGQGCAPDPAEALSWFVRAARQGNAKAMNMVGRYREEGWRGRTRPQAAFAWYRRAATGGDFRGQFNYGRLLVLRGRRDEGLSWISAAIEGGIPVFCRNVGEDLQHNRDPALRALGLRALDRARESGAPHDAAADRAATAGREARDALRA